MVGGSRLAGRSALVTGGSRGIGLGIADCFAAQGADLLLLATSEEKLSKAKDQVSRHGTKIQTIAADVSDREACGDAVGKAISSFGKLDILVNCAAIYVAKPFTEYTPEEFARIQQINVHGPFHLMQAALPHMTARKYGKIINVASTAGKWGSVNQSAYNASKHALVGLTRCVALETAKTGINVNAICPGLVDTDMIPQFMNEHSAISKSPPETVKQELMKRVPIGRLIDPSECGHLAVYLASSESDGMTGQSILLDGGMLLV